jgi:hypothetical protein
METSKPSILAEFDNAKSLMAEKGKLTIDKWRRGEKPIGAIVAIVLIGLVGWATIKYALPTIFTELGHTIATILSVAITALAIMSIPTIYKLFRRIVRSFHQIIIRWKPFEELDDYGRVMYKNLDLFLNNKATIKKLRNNFEEMSKSTQQAADDAKNEISRQTRKAGLLKEELNKLVAEKGEQVKETDEYVEVQQKFINATSAGNRLNTTMDKNIEWTKKYAARSNVFANLDRKLAIGATLLENKIKDYEEGVKILKKDWELSTASRGATDILNRILGKAASDWKVEYALEYVSDKIHQDVAITAQNLEDLERNTSAFNFDSDEAYDKLLAISNKIDAGQVVIPEASRISNPNHKLTVEEKTSAGPFGNIFN